MPATEGTGALPTDSSNTAHLGLWDASGAKYYALRADNGTAKNLRVALYDASGNPLGVNGNGLVASVANFPATQAVSAVALPLPSGAASEATLATLLTLSGFQARVPTSGQKAMAASLPVVIASDQSALPVSGTVAVSNFPATQPVSGTVTANVGTTNGLALDATLTGGTVRTSLGTSAGKTNVLRTGTLVTTAVTADQVVLTCTVTAAKTFYLQYVHLMGRLTTLSATASILGTISLETPSGTKAITATLTNATISAPQTHSLMFAEPIAIAAGTVVRVVVTPAATTSMTWIANFGGYER
jgi:hypothetical protein